MIRSSKWSRSIVPALLCAVAASVPGYAHAQVALKFEVEGLDLDTGNVSASRRGVFDETPEADLLIAYNSDVTPHSVLEGNERSGVQLAFVDEAFESVTSDDLAGLSFSSVMERPFGGAGTFVVRSSRGAHFKLGNAVESALDVSFDTAPLSSGGGSAGMLSGPGSRAALPPGVTPAEWQTITRQILGVPQQGIAGATALAYGLCLLILCGAFALPARSRAASHRFKWAVAGVLALSGASAAYAAPVFFESAAIQATPGEAGELFGEAIAATDDTLVVGAINADRGTVADAGAVYVFNRDAAGNWVQHSRLVPSDPPARDSFGATVAIEGDTLVVGAPLSGQSGLLQSGAAYVFTRNAAGVWSQQQKLIASDRAQGDFFGATIALSGNTLMVAATNDDNVNPNGAPPAPLATPDTGSVYVFTRSGSVWTQQSKILPPLLPYSQSDRFGGRIALDGNIAAFNSNQSTRFGFFIYERTGSGPFVLSTQLNTQPDQVVNLGAVLLLQGTSLVIGSAAHDQIPGLGFVGDSGAVVIYDRVAPGSWTLSTKLFASNPAQSARFGTQVVIRDDVIVASKRFTRTTGELVAPPGEGYVFTRSGGVWTEEARLQVETPLFEESFGMSLAIAGESALVGAPGATRCEVTGCTLPKGTVYEYVVIGPQDNTPPGVTVPINMLVEAQFAGGATVVFDASADDDVDGSLTPECTPASDSVFPIATTTVTCTATDAAGNSASASFMIEVRDSTPPDAECTDVVLECTGPQTPVTTSCTATDAVDSNPTITSSAQASYGVGFHFYTCSAHDDYFNFGTEQCHAHVQDTTPPTCIPPETGFISCTHPGGIPSGLATVIQHLNQIESDDLCTPSGSRYQGPSFLPASCDGFTSTFTYTVDDSRGNEATCTTDIVVTDNGGVLTLCPDDMQLECNSAGGVDAGDGNVASWLADAAAEDACNEVALTSTAPPFYPLGETRVFFTGEDACGHTSTCPAVMTVVDTTPPQVSCEDVVAECTGALTPVTTTCSAPDVCDAAPDVASDADPSYALGEHTYSCEAMDGSGNGAQASCQVTVVDTTAPVLSGVTTVTTPIAIATTFQASAHFTDACGPHTGTFDWGDGTTSPAIISEGAGQGDASASHAYAVPGIYTVTLTLSDASGNTSSSVSSQDVIVAHPDGFVTGAGKIDSPAGAYAPDPALTGTVQFNFKAQYHNGATLPTGHTQLRFRAAELEFDSTSYDWLVVNGTNVRYKGVGTLNGVAGYSFLLAATDAGNTGHNDKFRMRIWSGSNVVYDNQRGAPDDATATQLITNGNINIH